MDFNSLSFIFNRALSLTFAKKKLLLVFCILALSGILIVFFRGVALHASQWVQLSLTFLPIFICAGILLSMGILLIRIYHDDIKKREENYLGIISHSWEILIGASYFAIPIILSYLLLWILLGIFVLLQEIPVFGEFFSLILSFAPFLINLATLILCLFSLLILFFVAPIIAFKGLDRGAVFQMTMKRLERDPFLNIILVVMALLPAAFILALLTIAAWITGSIAIEYQSSLHTTLKWFFIMLPFTAFLTPPVIFFFNFAAESHVLMQKQLFK
ncbi:hypothetical protein [Candidatus Protochlamydia phocaeensis]|uniref:hypothetical protein n=1 Tax=Candidatus Protochlamydia phocaeensis TaxID=1414722 RepID=UPI000838EBFF|nr:hypothetical protein [Candidatus Protochlamydia phocaeensis]